MRAGGWGGGEGLAAQVVGIAEVVGTAEVLAWVRWCWQWSVAMLPRSQGGIVLGLPVVEALAVRSLRPLQRCRTRKAQRSSYRPDPTLASQPFNDSTTPKHVAGSSSGRSRPQRPPSPPAVWRRGSTSTHTWVGGVG